MVVQITHERVCVSSEKEKDQSKSKLQQGVEATGNK